MTDDSTRSGAKSRTTLDAAALSKHIVASADSGAMIDPTLGTKVGWIRAVREVANVQPDAALRAVAMLQDRFPAPFFSAIERRLRASSKRIRPYASAEVAAEYMVTCQLDDTPVDPDFARVSTWAKAIAVLMHDNKNAVVRHAMITLAERYDTPFFAKVRTRMDVEARDELAPLQTARRTRRYLEAAFAAGRPVRPRKSRQAVWASVIRKLVKSGAFATVSHALDDLITAYPYNNYFTGLRETFDRLPDENDLPTTFGEDRSLKQLVPFAGATTLVVVFSDPYTSSLVHRWLHAARVHVVYLRDTSPRLFTRGAPGMTDSFDATVVAIRTLASSLGADRIAFLGGSMWGYPAIRYALEIEGARALAYSPITFVEEDQLAFIQGRAQQRGMADVTMDEVRAIDLVPHLIAADGRAQIKVIYSVARQHDATQAERIATLPGVALEGSATHTVHNMLKASLQDGLIANHLDWLLGSQLSQDNMNDLVPAKTA